MGKKRKIFIVIFAAIIVMIHAGGGTIYNAYARSYDGRVNLKIYQVGNLFQNSRSFHTSAMGQFICAFNRWEREPKVLVGVINGNLPILFYNNEKDTYGYVDKTGKVIIKDDYFCLVNFNTYNRFTRTKKYAASPIGMYQIQV